MVIQTKEFNVNGLTYVIRSAMASDAKELSALRQLGFEVEGVLKRDKILSDGNYYNTIVMGRFQN